MWIAMSETNAIKTERLTKHYKKWEWFMTAAQRYQTAQTAKKLKFQRNAREPVCGTLDACTNLFVVVHT